jgi:hypothetical protein
MLYDIHTGNPLDVPPLTQAFIATAEPYAVTEAQALKMLGGMAPGKHTFAEITEAARKHANTDLFHRGPSGRVFVRVGREFHAVGVGKSNGARLSTSSRPDLRIVDDEAPLEEIKIEGPFGLLVVEFEGPISLYPPVSGGANPIKIDVGPQVSEALLIALRAANFKHHKAPKRPKHGRRARSR